MLLQWDFSYFAVLRNSDFLLPDNHMLIVTPDLGLPAPMYRIELQQVSQLGRITVWFIHQNHTAQQSALRQIAQQQFADAPHSVNGNTFH